MNDSIKDNILLLLAIKPEEKIVPLEHIYEKVHRDTHADKNIILKALNELIDAGLVEEVPGGYRITPTGRIESLELAFKPSLNKSYRLVLTARWYYKFTEKLILPFLIGRPVSLVKVFSDDRDPINKVKPIFSRYAKQRPKVYNYINSSKDFWRCIDAHAIDFIPYVHANPDAQYPDWFVIDIDAGESIKNAGEKGFELIKEITLIAYYTLLDDFEIKASIKFSGSRGFQLWAVFDQPLGAFDVYRDAIKVVQREVEKNLEDYYDDLKARYGTLIEFPITTSDVANATKRRNKILFDWSSMKKEGDVRAPWSIHWKTELISVPVDPKKLADFTIDQADPRSVISKLDEIRHLFNLKISTPVLLKKATRPSLDLFFG